ncbi:CRISPR-associated RAMP protein Csx10 [Anabaena sp. UHCC 0399]|uniref:type III-D CRISPR-associated RAMP protein Csx10 n=1 Tax=Anabaena sp. UHCC 0399 TaxID=3110238 RepID=UPI002B1FE22A|nr:CRISPR-associated RAMP protein Csx10 [Anabaena sp. UHCC 0399]MEA5565765.1 CRISPR-associated RAMP protein Csx10 [Anabaena sp. UHCC 0399]
MKRIKLNITALSPLAIAGQKPGSVSEAEDHIPGSVIRGALASQILQLSQQQIADIADQDLTANGGEFASLFLSDEPAIFQNAYPGVAKIGEISQVVTDDVMVLPATAVSSKTKSGFKSNKGNGVFDTLIDRFCANAYNYPYDPSDPESIKKNTDTRVEPYTGFYSCHDGKYRSHSVSTRFLTRVGINRRRATSEEEILYSIEVLNESFVENPKEQNWHPVVYRSAILLENEDLAKSLAKFINDNSHIFRLGGATSRGLGKVQIEAELEEASTDVEKRITKFNEQLKQRWQLWSVFGQPENNLLENWIYFTIDLQSDAILTENWRRTTVISEKMLKQFTEINDCLELHTAYSSYNYRSGWNAAWGLMKDIELVTTRGAVYLFSVNKEKEKIWTDKLQELELKGVGDRTCEGFGQVQICNEFHNVFRENAK